MKEAFAWSDDMCGCECVFWGGRGWGVVTIFTFHYLLADFEMLEPPNHPDVVEKQMMQLQEINNLKTKQCW